MHERGSSGRDHQLWALAARQLGMVTRRQAADLGLNADAMARRLRRGEWIAVTGVVLRAASAPDHALARGQAALLHVGRDAALAGQSASAFWDVPGFRLEPVDVIRGRKGTTASNELCRVHRVRHSTTAM